MMDVAFINGQCFGFTGTPNDLLPMPMDKHDHLVTDVCYSVHENIWPDL